MAPILQARLAASPAAGHSGQLHVGFYADGLRLTFDEGRLVIAESRPNPARPRSGASFPALTFRQLLFGYRSLEELEHAFPDCIVRTGGPRAPRSPLPEEALRGLAGVLRIDRGGLPLLGEYF